MLPELLARQALSARCNCGQNERVFGDDCLWHVVDVMWSRSVDVEVGVYASGGSPSVRCGPPVVTVFGSNFPEMVLKSRGKELAGEVAVSVVRQEKFGVSTDGRPAFEVEILDKFC